MNLSCGNQHHPVGSSGEGGVQYSKGRRTSILAVECPVAEFGE